MGTKKGWKELNTAVAGLAFVQSLSNLEEGKAGWVEIDLGDRWVRIVADPSAGRLVISPIEAPIELVDVVKED